MGFDVYLSWDGMTPEDERAQNILWDTRFGHTGYLRAGLPMKREIRVLTDIFPEPIPWWKGPPRIGNAQPYDFAANFPKMRTVTEGYLKAVNSKRALDYFLCLPPRSMAADSADETLNSAEGWVRSLIDFFRLGLSKQKEGKNPKVEVT